VIAVRAPASRILPASALLLVLAVAPAQTTTIMIDEIFSFQIGDQQFGV
jgi:hypothetical protein